MIDIKLGVCGQYCITKKRHGNVTFRSDWFDNLITNLGMDNLGTDANAFSNCHVGSGNAAPSFTDTALQTFVAGSAFVNPATSIDSPGRYWVATYSYTFPAGSATGNLTEVGTGTAALGTVLSSRALILDGGGAPTSITVLADEDLVVQYRFRVKQPVADFAGTVDGKTITMRAAFVNTLATSSGWRQTITPFTCSNAGLAASAFSGAIGSISDGPSGILGSVSTFSQNDAAYIAGSYTRTGSYLFSGSEANGNILSFVWVHGVACWQMQMDSVISKTSPLTFRIGVRTTWARE
jgi:hypothetical protein